jgi:hypothetical protein
MNITGSTLVTGLRFTFLLGSAQRLPPAGPAAFFLVTALSIGTDFFLNLFLVNSPEHYIVSGFANSAFWIAQALLLAWLLTLWARRPAWIWSVATWLLLISLFVRAVVCPILSTESDFNHVWPTFAKRDMVIALGGWTFASALRIWRWLEPPWHWVRVVNFAVLTAALFSLPHHYLPYRPGYIVGSYEEDDSYDESDGFNAIVIEDLFAEQDQRVDAALAALAPQRPGHVDVYLVALAGYAGENVFSNEVRYVRSLFESRFDAEDRSLLLINHLDTLQDTPLATERNLRRTLNGIAQRIDLDEDIVFLFLTSHGSDDHQFAIELGDLTLQQITPDSLAEAIDESKIRWRVAAISACYSGGYIGPLSADTALVMTAARSDRTSFGCGADSDITYFGRAYFAEALNQTDDFVAAFKIAKDAIAKRERADGETPSKPQIASTPLIEAKLAEWRSQQQPGPPLPFAAPVKDARPATADAQ